MPGVFGVFFYRSANAQTLNALKSFLPVPVEGLTRDFDEGATAEEVCARTIRALMDAGAQALLHQQPARRPRATGSRRHNAKGPGDRMRVSNVDGDVVRDRSAAAMPSEGL